MLTSLVGGCLLHGLLLHKSDIGSVCLAKNFIPEDVACLKPCCSVISHCVFLFHFRPLSMLPSTVLVTCPGHSLWCWRCRSCWCACFCSCIVLTFGINSLYFCVSSGRRARGRGFAPRGTGQLWCTLTNFLRLSRALPPSAISSTSGTCLPVA